MLRFGAATAAYQIEGAVAEDGRGESIWDRFTHAAGGDTGDVACDHYHRWADDLDLMASLGLESYRFSIAWPRVQPDGRGPLNARGVAWYRRLVEGLLERGIEPVATLYHWDLPQALQETGGWAERDTASRFAEYAAAMAASLGDVVSGWITHNEPHVVAFAGHLQGRKAPGVRDWRVALRVAHHLLVSHGLAVDALRAGSGAPVGITLNVNPIRGADVDAVARFDAYQNRWFLDPVLRGAYPPELLASYERAFGALELDGLRAVKVDFLGVNYYFPIVARASSVEPLRAETVPASGESLTAMGWAVDASGLFDLLTGLRADYGDIPIWITENGAAYDDETLVDGVVEDPSRVVYLDAHLQALSRAIAAGVDVRRYFVWSLLDNFEWEHGYARRFGIVRVDYATQRRIVKRSALWYRDHVAKMAAARWDSRAVKGDGL